MDYAFWFLLGALTTFFVMVVLGYYLEETGSVILSIPT